MRTITYEYNKKCEEPIDAQEVYDGLARKALEAVQEDGEQKYVMAVFVGTNDGDAIVFEGHLCESNNEVYDAVNSVPDGDIPYFMSRMEFSELLRHGKEQDSES